MRSAAFDGYTSLDGHLGAAGARGERRAGINPVERDPDPDGLRYEEEQVDAIIEGVTAMLFGIRRIEESSVYQGILRKGEAEGRAEGRAEGEAVGIREALFIQGRKKLGPLDEKTVARLVEIQDLDHLKRQLERILDVSRWDELLAPGDPVA
jgi:hypothetical protein